MSRWRETTRAAAEIFEATEEIVEAAVGMAGDAAADVVETAGHVAQDVFRGIGLPDRLGSVVAGVTNLFGATIKSAFGMAGGMSAGCCRSLAGVLQLDADRIIEGNLDVRSSVAGGVIMITGTFIAVVQRLFFLQNVERPLSEDERELLRPIFHASICLFNVRIVEGWCGLFGITDRPFTLGNTIYFQSVNPRKRPYILVHECVHVWQYQNIGARYTVDALVAQAAYGRGAYDWRAELERGSTEWSAFNREAQAELIQNIWTDGALSRDGKTLKGSGAFFDLDSARSRLSPADAAFFYGGTDYSSFAVASIAALRGHANIRSSGLSGNVHFGAGSIDPL